MAGGRSPPDHGGECPSGTPNNNILWRRALEPHGVDDRIEENGKRQNDSCQSIGRNPHKTNRQAGKPNSVSQSLVLRNTA